MKPFPAGYVFLLEAAWRKGGKAAEEFMLHAKLRKNIGLTSRLASCEHSRRVSVTPMDARKHVAASWEDADDDEASAPAQEPALVAESWEDSDAEPEVPSSKEADAEEPAAKDAEEPVANATEEAVVKEIAALSPTSAESQPAMPPPPRLAKDWRTPPKMTDAQKTELSKRLLQCETVFGLVASVHLDKVNARSGAHMELGRSVYSWIFDAHHIVLGDVNCEWRNMIGGVFVDRGGTSKEVKMEAWVKPETHAAAIRPGGTYLPGVTQEKVPRWKGDKVTVDPPAFDLVVVARPYAVDLLKKQPGRAFQPAKLPRLLMQSLPPDGWPSDHTSVVAVVRAASQPARTLRVATWNVADPWYFAQFWGEACSFGFEREREAQRLEHIERHVAQARAAARSLLAPLPRAPHNHAPHPLCAPPTVTGPCAAAGRVGRARAAGGAGAARQAARAPRRPPRR